MRCSIFIILLLCSCAQHPRPRQENIEEIPVSIRGIYQIESLELDGNSIDVSKADGIARKMMISDLNVSTFIFPEMDHMYGFVLFDDAGKCLLTMKCNDKGTGPNTYSLEYARDGQGLITFRGSNKDGSDQITVVMKRLSSDYGLESILRFYNE